MKVIAIDLDDTLFSEMQYVKSGFRAVANKIALHSDNKGDIVYNQIMYQFFKYGRAGVFNRTMYYFGINEPNILELINVYRTHKPNINLYHNVEKALKKLCLKFKIVIVTDGLGGVQRKKIEALNLEHSVDMIVYCMDHNAPKPSSIPYRFIAKKLSVDVEDMIIIGDDPYADMVAAADLGIMSYRVLTGKYMSVDSHPNAMPVAEFDSFFMVADKLLGEY